MSTAQTPTLELPDLLSFNFSEGKQVSVKSYLNVPSCNKGGDVQPKSACFFLWLIKITRRAMSNVGILVEGITNILSPSDSVSVV